MVNKKYICLQTFLYCQTYVLFILFIYRFLTELFFIKNIFKHNPIKNIEEVKIFIFHIDVIFLLILGLDNYQKIQN